jgi:hypothetical protein
MHTVTTGLQKVKKNMARRRIKKSNVEKENKNWKKLKLLKKA